MAIRQLKIGKMSDKMRQDGGKMRKVKDVSSVLALPGGRTFIDPPTVPRPEAPGRSPP